MVELTRRIAPDLVHVMMVALLGPARHSTAGLPRPPGALRLVITECREPHAPEFSDCPDVATVDGHLVRLSRRVATGGVESPDVVEVCRTDIDRLLDRRAWLTLPVAPRGFRLRMAG